MTSEYKVKVLFVCFGNTCRSPMAEAILKEMVEKKNLSKKFYIDSAGLSSWQVGCDINPYTDVVLKQKWIQNFQHKARKISKNDFKEFDYILGMDFFHMKQLGEIADVLKSSSKVLLLGSFNPNQEEMIIEDPICGDQSDFDKCYSQISASCVVFLNEIIDNLKLMPVFFD